MVNVYKKNHGMSNLKLKDRMTSMSAEQRHDLAVQGGRANKGLKKIHYTKCAVCELKDTCERAFEEGKKMHEIGFLAERNGNPDNINVSKCKDFLLGQSRCAYELEHAGELRGKVLKSFHAFTSADPTDLLKKIHVIFCKLEGQVDADPSFAKYAQLYYMLTNLYKIKFNDKSVSSVSINNSISGESKGATIDVKMIMSQIRKEQSEIENSRPADIVQESDEDDEEGVGA
jgi:hypothetical protein